MGAVLALCCCVEPDHERAGCHLRLVGAERARLYSGLFDEHDDGAPPAARHRSVRLLNPGYRGADSASRRFALLEIDDA